MFRIDEPDVPVIRHHLGLTQERFAELLGIGVARPRGRAGNGQELGTGEKEARRSRPSIVVRCGEKSQSGAGRSGSVM